MHIIFKLTNVKDKEIIIKAAAENNFYMQETPIKKSNSKEK